LTIKQQNINIKNCSLSSITLTFRRCDGGYYHLFNDFCGLLSVAVNTMDKLQFVVLIFITVKTYNNINELRKSYGPNA